MNTYSLTETLFIAPSLPFNLKTKSFWLPIFYFSFYMPLFVAIATNTKYKVLVAIVTNMGIFLLKKKITFHSQNFWSKIKLKCISEIVIT